MKKLSEINESLWKKGFNRGIENNLRREEISKFFDHMYYKKYVNGFDISPTGEVNVDGSVFLTVDDLVNYEIPFKFGKISGSFRISYCHLKSFNNCPDEVGKDFTCHDLWDITSLEGCPKKVGTDFYVHNCKSLFSLDGCPEEVGGTFCTSGSKLKFTEDEITKRCKVGRHISV